MLITKRVFSRAAFAALMTTVFTTPAFSGTISFTGNFVNDNDVQLLALSLLSDATVTLQTLGYGGGTNGNGQVIPAGGFESVLQVYAAPSGMAVGGPIQPGPNPTCGPRTPDPGRLGFCQDAYLQMFLTAGNYSVALTQSPNDPLGNLSDGFFYVDAVPDPNFNNGFVGTFGFQGTSAWAVDISFPGATQVPEPATALLTMTGLIVSGIASRKRRWPGTSSQLSTSPFETGA